MALQTPDIELVADDPSGPKLIATGDWTASGAEQLCRKISEITLENIPGSTVLVDLSKIRHLDTYGTVILRKLGSDLKAVGVAAENRGLAKHNRPLLDMIISVNLEPADGSTAGKQLSIADYAVNGVSYLWHSMSCFLAMAGTFVSQLGILVKNPSGFRMTPLVNQIDRVCWQAIPIILLVTVIIGAIIAQQGFFHFRQFGAEVYVIDMTGFLVMREIGVLLVAIVVAGRSGSAMTAELGSMKMREEIDALRTMGKSPANILILPRILALVVAMPMLTFIGSMAALTGAGIVSVFYGDVSLALYLDRLKDVISYDHFNVGMIKAPFIGAVIGIVACTEGMQVRGSAISLGQHTTQSVVKAIFMVILMDGLFALFFSAIRM